VRRGEFAENAIRKDFLPSEIDAIRRALEPMEKAAAKDRMSAGGKGCETFATFAHSGQNRRLRWRDRPTKSLWDQSGLQPFCLS
jgi:hypothetical protein